MEQTLRRAMGREPVTPALKSRKQVYEVLDDTSPSESELSSSIDRVTSLNNDEGFLRGGQLCGNQYGTRSTTCSYGFRLYIP